MEEKHNEELIKIKFDEVAYIVEKGDSDQLRRILENGQFDDINERKDTRSGPTLLMIACKSGFIECVKVLLDNNVELNRGYEIGEILRCVCHSGSVEMVRFITASGLRVCDEAIMSVFQTLNLIENTEIITILVQYIDNINFYAYGTFVYWASKDGNVVIVRALLERGADPNKIFYDYDDALFVAAGQGHINVIKLLLTWDTIDKPIWQERLVKVLKQASSRGHVDVVCFLVEYGIAVSGLTAALVSAVAHNQVEVVSYLIDHGADYNNATIDEYTLLTYSCNKHYVDMVRLLLAHGVDMDAADYDGSFPLDFAIYYTDILQLLLEAGADPNVRFCHGTTALLNAVSSTDVVPGASLLLLQHGADPNLADAETDFTPLMAAASAARVDLVRQLLEHGADVTQVNHAGQTVLDILGPGHSVILELCMQYMKPVLK